MEAIKGDLSLVKDFMSKLESIQSKPYNSNATKEVNELLNSIEKQILSKIIGKILNPEKELIND